MPSSDGGSTAIQSLGGYVALQQKRLADGAREAGRDVAAVACLSRDRMQLPRPARAKLFHR